MLSFSDAIVINGLGLNVTASLVITAGVQNSNGAFVSSSETVLSPSLPLSKDPYTAASSLISLTGYSPNADYIYEDVRITITNSTASPVAVNLDPCFAVTASPEPSTIVLCGMGLTVLPGLLWRRKKTAA